MKKWNFLHTITFNFITIDHTHNFYPSNAALFKEEKLTTHSTTVGTFMLMCVLEMCYQPRNWFSVRSQVVTAGNITTIMEREKVRNKVVYIIQSIAIKTSEMHGHDVHLLQI